MRLRRVKNRVVSRLSWTEAAPPVKATPLRGRTPPGAREDGRRENGLHARYREQGSNLPSRLQRSPSCRLNDPGMDLFISRGPERLRTSTLPLKRRLLYRLSYESLLQGAPLPPRHHGRSTEASPARARSPAPRGQRCAFIASMRPRELPAQRGLDPHAVPARSHGVSLPVPRAHGTPPPSRNGPARPDLRRGGSAPCAPLAGRPPPGQTGRSRGNQESPETPKAAWGIPRRPSLRRQ